MSLWWVGVLSATMTVILTMVLLYKRESNRVGHSKTTLDEDNDEKQEKLMDDYRGRAIRRIHQINQLRKSPSKLRLALKNYFKKRAHLNRVMADGNAEHGNGLHSLYTKPVNPDLDKESLVRSQQNIEYDSTVEESANDATSDQTIDQKILNLRAFAFRSLKKKFSFIEPNQLAALSVDATEVNVSRGGVLFSQGTHVATPSIYIVQSGLLECTCDGGLFLSCCIALFDIC